ncbi:hypothetical protein BDZ97DRAFT_1856349 [Flammula alnicola]|nr:hypothetical protein BDZ97DRAFT_1856349 [Flammula alnicola]
MISRSAHPRADCAVSPPPHLQRPTVGTTINTRSRTTFSPSSNPELAAQKTTSISQFITRAGRVPLCRVPLADGPTGGLTAGIGSCLTHLGLRWVGSRQSGCVLGRG